MDQPSSFLWHDYETFGSNTRQARPAQFAAIRTDAALEPVGEPMILYCRPADDFLPDPQACLITGITPQACLQKGLAETEFAERIAQAMAVPGTVAVGYNSIRFDDEITRFMLWRNLLDPYAREWQNGCGRWDMLDVVRAAYALRPQGLTWPVNAEGRASFKLTDLTEANGIAHESAHDALSDVQATLALARLLRQAQPRLFDFCLGLRDKRRVAQELGLPESLAYAQPFVHVSGMFGPERGCMAIMAPLAMHPGNKNELLAWDLAQDPAELAELKPDQVRQRLFTRTADLPEGVARLPIKSVHLNKSPMVMRQLKVLTDEQAARWGVVWPTVERHLARLRALPDLSALWAAVFAREQQDAPVDVDEDLYGGFLGDADRQRLTQVRRMHPDELARHCPGFDDPRLSELVWRWRARNFAHTLTPPEQQRWHRHRVARLHHGAGGALTLQAYLEQIDTLAENADDAEQDILGALVDYADAIAPDLS